MRLALIAMLLVADGAHAGAPRVLRVCAAPTNVTFSSERAPGFESEIAAVLARELGMKLEYTWWAQRREFFRNLEKRRCDAVIGVPVGLGMAHTTAPYYRSSFAFVSRADRGLDIHSLADPRLATLSIGVQLGGDDRASPPPAHALAARGIVDNVVGFEDVMRAVVDGQVDLAIVWGPLAAGFASCLAAKLVVTPVDEAEDGGVPLAFDIAIGVRRSDPALAAQLDRALVARHAEIVKILDAWQVPRVPAGDVRSSGARDHRGSPIP